MIHLTIGAHDVELRYEMISEKWWGLTWVSILTWFSSRWYQGGSAMGFLYWDQWLKIGDSPSGKSSMSSSLLEVHFLGISLTWNILSQLFFISNFSNPKTQLPTCQVGFKNYNPSVICLSPLHVLSFQKVITIGSLILIANKVSRYMT